MRERKNIVFDVDGTIADVEHRRHFVSEGSDWNAFREATVDDTPVQWVCDIAKRFIAQGESVAFFSARNESEREITEKQISEWIGVDIVGFFLYQTVISDPMKNSNQTLLLGLKKSAVKSTLFLTTGTKLLKCGEKEALRWFK